MAKKLLFGAALLGAGVYYYDQQVQPILPRNASNQISVAPPAEVKKAARETEAKTKEVGAHVRDLGSLVKKTVGLQADAVEKKGNSVIESIKDTETYNRWSEKLDSYSQDVKTAAEEVDNKPLGNWIAVKYIDFVNRLGQTEDEKLKELASSTSARQQEIKKDLSKETRWFSWWSDKKEDARAKADDLAYRAEQEKKGWVNWGNDKVETEKNKWYKWGNAKKEEAKAKGEEAQADLKASLKHQQKELGQTFEEGKSRAVAEYNRARSNLEDLLKKTGDKASDLADDSRLRKAKKDLESAGESLRLYGADLVDQAIGRK